MTSIMSLGVIYIATGKKYIDEACQSASSLKDKNPNISITIFSSEKVEQPYFEQVVIVKNPQYNYKDKVLHMNQSPYERTLFLDTDTYICSDISELFTLLEKFDIAAAHTRTLNPIEVEGVPKSFSGMNTGVILFKKTPQIRILFSNWLMLHEQNMQEKGENAPDSSAFREALYKSELRIATLTPEYNCRFRFSTGVCEVVKILHGRYPDMPALAKEINKETGVRFFIMGIGLINDTKLLSRIKRLSGS